MFQYSELTLKYTVTYAVFGEWILQACDSFKKNWLDH